VCVPPPDLLAEKDLAVAEDLAWSEDLGVAEDLASPVDQSGAAPDLASAADQSVASPGEDLAGPMTAATTAGCACHVATRGTARGAGGGALPLLALPLGAWLLRRRRRRPLRDASRT
jgi:uncharacterized protein (TIGR03382 family)